MYYAKKIKCPLPFNSHVVDKINFMMENLPDEKMYFEIPNTKGISSNVLRRLNPNTLIRVAGSYDEELIKRRGNDVFRRDDGTVYETGEYLTTSVIYTAAELVKIVEEMEKIEKGFENQNFTELEKLVYVYGKLKQSVFYDPKYEEKHSYDIRSLRGLITKQTVCAGYAVILKEMMDRQGIKCNYVSGTTRTGGGHAWNIIEIDGKNYPIDLTWDNSQYRSGNMNTFDYLGQDIEQFKKQHIAQEGDPCKHYVLHEIDSKIIDKLATFFAREKDYETTTYTAKRNDGSRYMVSQVGSANGYYRYYYADLLPDGSIINPTTLYSRTNIVGFVDDLRFKNQGRLIQGYGEGLNEVLFSRSNIIDSKARGTSYIGDLEVREGHNVRVAKNISELQKYQNITDTFPNNQKVFKRSDGSLVLVEKMGKVDEVKGVDVYIYHIFETVLENGRKIVKRNVVSTEQDLMRDTRQETADIFLERSRLDRKVKEAGGYIGYFNEHNQKIYRQRLVDYFKTRPRKEEEETKETKKSPIREWAENFIREYEITESDSEYVYRHLHEDNNILRVVYSITNGKFVGNYDNLATDFNQMPENVMYSMARLLKTADILTIEEKNDFLESFLNLPDVKLLLSRIKNSKEYSKMHQQAEQIVKSGKTKPKKWTRAEVDNKFAKAYIANLKFSYLDVDKKINQVKKKLKNDDRISTEVGVSTSDEVPKIDKQKISFMRTIARQNAILPINNRIINGKFIFDLDKKTREKLAKLANQKPLMTNLDEER